jgi:hypothetical protein
MPGGKCHCSRAVPGYVSSVNWQTTVSLIIVAVAASGLIWGAFRRRRFRFARNTHCGCSGGQHPSGAGSIVFHARRDGRRRIIVKNK